MLIASFLAIGGATWAWFASSNKVTATDMQIRVRADGTYLLIAPGHLDVDDIQDLEITTANANASTSLHPVDHDSITNTSDADTAANWYYKHSLDPGSSGGVGNETEKYYLTTPVFPDYVLANEFGITVADGAYAVRNLHVDECTISTAGNQAVKVLITSDTAAVEFSGTGGSDATILSSSGVDGNTAVYFKVYIYWDGKDDDIYTNNIQQLKATTIELVFAGDIVEPT